MKVSLAPREPPQCVDPLSSWLGRRKSVVYVAFLIEKVAYDKLVCGVKV